MKKFLNYVVTILLIVVQVTVLSRFKIAGLNFNLALTCVIIVSAVADVKTSIINAAVAGVLFDVFACYTVGWHLVMFTVISLLMYAMIKYMYHGSMVAVAVLTAVLTLITELILYNFGYTYPQNYGSFAFLRYILPQIFMNTLSSLVLFPLYKKINETKTRYRY